MRSPPFVDFYIDIVILFDIIVKYRLKGCSREVDHSHHGDHEWRHESADARPDRQDEAELSAEP